MKHKKIQKYLLITTILISSTLIFSGCKNQEETPVVESSVDQTDEVNEVLETTESETVTEETAESTEEVKTVEETTESESVEETTQPDKFDWETFAAQEDSNDICLAVYNELTGEQTVVKKDKGFYAYKKGDRISVPIRDDIFYIYWKKSDVDGNLVGDKIDLYKSSNEDQKGLKYVEFTVGDEPAYYIILDGGEETASFMVSLVAE